MQAFHPPQQDGFGEPSKAGASLVPHAVPSYTESPPMYNRPAPPRVMTDNAAPGPPFYSRDAESISPHDSHSMMGDSLRPGTMGSTTPSPGQMSAHMMMMQNPKRAYRQRRKDPSCDACRERKVKCDATDMSSCTECSSRNVRCQFTKDTNRRMSSIKQVQDLERQLIETRQQLERVRAKEAKVDPFDEYSPESAQAVVDVPLIGRSPRRMLKARTPQDLSQARSNLADVGRGVLKPPVTSAQPLNSRHGLQSHDTPPFPPRASADRYLELYFACIHRYYPVLHWQTFRQYYLEVYEGRGPKALSPELCAVFFVVFACGALSAREPAVLAEAQDYLTRAVSTINFWEDDVSTNQAIVAFLASIFLAEVNRKTASWIWAGSAIRMAQDLGLHVQGGQWSPVEGEMRKRIWYSFYVWDRILAMELGKPMVINDEECDTEYPEPLDEERSQADASNSWSNLPPASLLLATVHIARLMAPMSRLFRSLCITNDTMVKFESHLGTCLSLYPQSLQLASTAPIDPRDVAPLIFFQNARLMLHRHNLSPSCSPEQRSHAVEYCVAAARDSARVVSRCILSESRSPLPEAERHLMFSANTMFCTHIWRAMLLLLFRPIDDAFFVLLRAANIVGSTKPINISCGRYLAFCLRKLVEKMESPAAIDLEQDEEIVVYLSSDLQSSTNSWVWGSAETGTHLSRRQKHGRPKQLSQDSDHTSPIQSHSPSWDSALSEEEQQDWGGWETVDRGARFLQSLQEKRLAGPPLMLQTERQPVSILPRMPGMEEKPVLPSVNLQPTSVPPQSLTPGPVLAPISPSSQSQSSDTTSGKSRMTIASII